MTKLGNVCFLSHFNFANPRRSVLNKYFLTLRHILTSKVFGPLSIICTIRSIGAYKMIAKLCSGSLTCKEAKFYPHRG